MCVVDYIAHGLHLQSLFYIWIFYIWRAACPRVPRLRNYKFGKTAFGGARENLQVWQNDILHIHPPKISSNAPPDFHKPMFGGGMAEKCRECQIMILAFLYLAGGMFENALRNLKNVI